MRYIVTLALAIVLARVTEAQYTPPTGGLVYRSEVCYYDDIADAAGARADCALAYDLKTGEVYRRSLSGAYVSTAGLSAADVNSLLAGKNYSTGPHTANTDTKWDGIATSPLILGAQPLQRAPGSRPFIDFPGSDVLRIFNTPTGVTQIFGQLKLSGVARGPLKLDDNYNVAVDNERLKTDAQIAAEYRAYADANDANTQLSPAQVRAFGRSDAEVVGLARDATRMTLVKAVNFDTISMPGLQPYVAHPNSLNRPPDDPGVYFYVKVDPFLTNSSRAVIASSDRSRREWKRTRIGTNAWSAWELTSRRSATELENDVAAAGFTRAAAVANAVTTRAQTFGIGNVAIANSPFDVGPTFQNVSAGFYKFEIHIRYTATGGAVAYPAVNQGETFELFPAGGGSQIVNGVTMLGITTSHPYDGFDYTHATGLIQVNQAGTLTGGIRLEAGPNESITLLNGTLVMMTRIP